MTTVTKYRIYCNTEGAWVEGWGESAPTQCYNDGAHDVNLNSVQDRETVSDSIVTVKEENTPTGGHIQLDSHTFDIAGGTTGEVTDFISCYPHPVNMISLTFCPSLDNIGDSIVADIGHHTTIGALGESVSAGITGGVTGFKVSSTVIDYMKVGYLVTLTDGVNTNELGRCVMVDKINNTISTEFATTNSFSVASPTYVQQTVEMIRNMYFPASVVPITVGDDKIGSSYVPEHVHGRIRYTNNDGKAKKFTFYMEYLY